MRENANRVLANRGISGAIFARPNNEAAFVGFDWDQFCSACISPLHFKPPFNSIEHDHGETLHLLWREAKRRGAKRIGAILQRDDQSSEFRNEMGSILYEQQLDLDDGGDRGFRHRP